jgi:hypothetical protein
MYKLCAISRGIFRDCRELSSVMTVHFTGPNYVQEKKSIYSMSCVVNKRQSGWYMLVRCLARVLHGDKVLVMY